jgi:hypothetical protein
VLSNAGGAQFGLGSSPARDLLVVYAEAFLRDADPEDFSLEALLAHECGHQIVYRNVAWQDAMMGNKKLSQIREELAQEIERAGLEPAEWYQQQLQRLQAQRQPDPADLESLKLIRDALVSIREPLHASGQ